MRAVPTILWVMLGLLGLTAGFLMLGQRETSSKPTITSFGPSGTAALAELLRQEGYRVVQTRESRPKLNSSQLLVRFREAAPRSEFTFGGEQDSSDWLTEADLAHLKIGGRVLVLNLGPAFSDDSHIASRNVSTIMRGEFETQPTAKLNINCVPSSELDVEARTLGNGWTAPIWRTGGSTFGELRAESNGVAMRFANGIFATNRFLDRNDNAKLIMATVASLATPGSTIVFDEGKILGVDDPGLMEAIGQWALAGWYQLLLCFAVICYSLGKPFGIPEPERTSQHGTRALLNAIGGLLRRGRATSLALESAASQAEASIFAFLKVPAQTKLADLRDRVPASLLSTLEEVRIASREKIRSDRARTLIARLDAELDATYGKRQSRRRPSRRARIE